MTFDAFLASPDQQDLARALLASLYELRGMAFIVGDATGTFAAQLAAEAAAQWPAKDVHVFGIEASPTRINGRVVEGYGTDAALRAALRQDPDVIVLATLEPAAAQIAMSAAQTGHALLVGTTHAEADAALKALCGDEAWLFEPMQPSVELVVELTSHEDRAVLHRVWRRGANGLEVLATSTTLNRALLPQASRAFHDSPRAPELSSRPAAVLKPRRAFLPSPHRGEGQGEGPAPHVIGGSTVLGTHWPACKQCQQPLQHVLQLNLATLPTTLELPLREGVVQLFVCPEGCDTTDEHAPGVHVARLVGEETRMTMARAASHHVVSPGVISEWTEFTESPGHDDDAPPLCADKLGGWPAWQQGEDWPLDDDGAPMTLLFQVQEGETREGGTPAGWNFEAARVTEGTPPTRVLDASRPRHFPSLLTGEATAWLFIGKTGRLAFRWQTG